MQGFRRATVHLALLAMLLRGLLPVGWMPAQNSETGSFLALCTMDGAVQTPDQSGKKAPADRTSHEECPFAAAPHLATFSALTAVASPAQIAMVFAAPAPLAQGLSVNDYLPQSPRAPPLDA